MKEETKYKLSAIFFIIALSGIVLWLITTMVWIVLHTSVIIGSIHDTLHDFYDLFTLHTTHPYRAMYMIGFFILLVFSVLSVLVAPLGYQSGYQH